MAIARVFVVVRGSGSLVRTIYVLRNYNVNMIIGTSKRYVRTPVQ